MFESLSNRLGDVFDRLRGRGALTEADVDAALREVRIALLEADVALPVVRDFVDRGARARRSARTCSARSRRARWWSRSSTITWSRCWAATAPSRPRPQRAAAGRDPDGRPAGLGQDHDLRQDRAAPARAASASKVLMASLDAQRPAAQEQLAHARRADRRRHPADRRRRDAARDHPARAWRRRGARATTSSSSTPPAGCTIDEELMDGGRGGPRRGQADRDAARRRRDDRPGRGQRRQGLQRARSASPASC